MAVVSCLLPAIRSKSVLVTQLAAHLIKSVLVTNFATPVLFWEKVDLW